MKTGARRPVCVCALVLLLVGSVWSGAAQYSDQCSWRGSGLTHQSHVRDVEQVYLRCSEGSLEWLYPTGAIIVNLRPNTDPPRTPQMLTACLRPRPGSSGASVYLRRGGELTLLLSEEEQAAGRQHCFSLQQQGALFIEATAHSDISRRVTAFQYQLISDEVGDEPTAPCGHCNDDKILMAVCTSDFVVRGNIQAIKNGDGGDEDDDEDHASLMVSSSHVYRQKKRVFVPAAGGTRGRGRWTGQVKVLQKCSLGVGQGEEFLLTGSVRFGEAWLGCALRYKDFLQKYHTAMRAGSNPCHIDTD